LGLFFFAAIVAIGAVDCGRRLNASLEFLSAGAWAVLVASTGSLLLAFSPFRKLESIGASRVGGVFLYIVLVTIGAKTNLFSVKGVPIYMAFGFLILAVHGILLLVIGRFLRVPVFLLATASQANIGGAISAPIVATVYKKGTAHIGVLMAILGVVLGTYLGVLGGWLCHFVARSIS
jgi:uncharacterized membrane protein